MASKVKRVPNVGLRAAREAEHLGRDELAIRLVDHARTVLKFTYACDVTKIYRWEEKGTRPRDHAIRILISFYATLGYTAADIGFRPKPAPTCTPDSPSPTVVASVLGSTTREDDDEMNRRHLLGAVSKASALALVSADGADGGREASGLAELDRRAELATHLWQVFSLTPSKRSVYPLVRHELDFLTAQLGLSHTPATRRRLSMMAGEVFQLAGEIFFDSNHYAEAASCYTTAAIASKEANAYDLWACALTRHALLFSTEQRFVETLPLLEAASRVASRGDHQLATRQWIANVQAVTFASLGEREAASRALDTAEGVRQLGVASQNGGWLRFDSSRLAEERGSCYLKLGLYSQAEAILDATLGQATSARRRCGILTDLARIGVERRDAESVWGHTDAALALARQTGSGYIGRKLADLCGELEPLRASKRIADLAAEIATLVGASGPH